MSIILFQLPLKSFEEAARYFSGEGLQARLQHADEIMAEVSLQSHLLRNTWFISRVLDRFFTQEYRDRLIYGSDL